MLYHHHTTTLFSWDSCGKFGHSSCLPLVVSAVSKTNIYYILGDEAKFQKKTTFSLDDASIDIIDMQTDSTVKAGLQSSERIERQI